MSALAGNDQDITNFLARQHEQIRHLLQDVETSSGMARESAFLQLRQLLAVHETAEEQVVHPRAMKDLDEDTSIVDERLAEEHKAKKVLTDLEKLDVDSTTFISMFADFKSDVIAHAESEEREEWPILRREEDPAALARMARTAQLAEKMAPSRPHAGVESAAGNAIVGPFAKMLDWARDAFERKDSRW